MTAPCHYRSHGGVLPRAVAHAVLCTLLVLPIAASAADEVDESEIVTGTEAIAPLPDLPPAATLEDILSELNTGLLTSDGQSALTFPTQPPLTLLDAEVPPGMAMRLAWMPGVAYDGLEAPTPVLVVNGTREGPTLCLTAAVHGDELNGIEIVRRVMHGIDPEGLSGALIAVPIVNLQGFHRGSRYLPDRRDLNRHFPGSPTGSVASRIAHSLLTEVIAHCTALVDLHTGSFHRTNLPQIRADLNDAAVLELTQGLGPLVVLQSLPAEGTLRRAAAALGIPAVTLEVGEPQRVEVDAVDEGVHSIAGLLHSLGMHVQQEFWDEPRPVYYESRWVRANHSGILLSEVELGDPVAPGHRLGAVIDPISNVEREIVSPVNGRVLGMALNQFVMPGYAAFRIGVERRSPGTRPTRPDDAEKPPDLHEPDAPADAQDLAELHEPGEPDEPDEPNEPDEASE